MKEPAGGGPEVTPRGPLQPEPVFLPLPVLRGRPWITWTLVGINIVLFLALTVAGGSTDSEVLLRFGAKYGPALLDGEYWRLFTAMFLHLGILHLAVNCYALFALGSEAERVYGRGRFSLVYLLTGVFSTATSYLFASVLAVGASGAIFGLVGAQAVFYAVNRKALGAFGRSRLNNLVSVVLINLVIGLSIEGVDNWAHAGGLVAGLVVGLALAPRYQLAVHRTSHHDQVVDANPLPKRWWIVPAALTMAAMVTWLGNMRESETAGGIYARGEVYLQEGAWHEAIDAFSTAVALEPDHWSAYILRAEAHMQLDQYEAALADFETVIRASESDEAVAIGHSGRGRIAMIYGDPEQALEDLDRAVQLAPDHPFPHYVRGLVLFEKGIVDEATQDLELALELGLGDPQSVSIARQILDQLGR